MHWIKILAVNLLVLLGVLIVLEFMLRVIIDFEANYYAAPKIVKENSERSHPYGKIPVNSLGVFDGEWDNPKKLPRIGYFGDSVTYGLGAGYPHRITEHLDILSPEFEHVNLSGGLGVSLTDVNSVLDFSYKHNIDKLIYLMNLNDIIHLAYYQTESKTIDTQFIEINKSTKLALFIKNFMYPIDKVFLGKSFLYSYSRRQLKIFLISVMGFELFDYKGIELRPEQNRNLIRMAAMNTAELANNIEKKIPFCVLILPYEMQISEHSATKYAELGFKFDKSFVDFGTQKIFTNYFSKYSNTEVHWLGSSFSEAEIGTYYVYKLGGHLDFNHPNRLGHKILANQISDENLCL
ncbi:MAG: hypothetical protein VXZ76_01425 [Bacteroidota bacterium]|nr:hypothetical protein [Bacteroidota bacterium]